MNQLVLPTSNPLCDEFDADLGPALTSVLELLRAHGFDCGEAQMGEFDIHLPSPFRLPQITWTPPSGTSGLNAQSCFTPQGRQWLATALPASLRLQHWRNSSGLEFKVLSDTIESKMFGPKLGIVDQMKRLSSLPDFGSAELLLPFQGALAA